MIFVDASALVAILTQEPECDAFLQILSRSDSNRTSAVAIYETVLSVARKKNDWETSLATVTDFIRELDIEILPIGVLEQGAALDAFAHYGKGRGNKAQLNLGDCFAYACAKTNNAALLYKGDDFTHTDIKAAV